MAKKKKHSRVEIASKLAQANDLATQGKLQRKRNRAHAGCECHDPAPVAQGAAGALARISGDPRGGSIQSAARRGRPNC